jgi:hypothetical protein
MRTGIDVCGPDTLKVLQQIFDSVWFQMQQEGLVDPADESMREQISRLVIHNADGDVLDVDGIKRAVLASVQRG